MRLMILGLLAFLATTTVQAQTNHQKIHHQKKLIEYSMFQAQPDVIKKPGRAVFISVAATLSTFVISPVLLNNDILYTASFLTVLALFSFAPGAGYLYIEDSDHFLKGGVQRALSILAVGTGGLIVVITLFDDFNDNDDNRNFARNVFGYGLMLSGFAFYVYTTFRDFIGVHRDAKLYNQEHNLSLRITPVVDPVNSVYGAGLLLKF